MEYQAFLQTLDRTFVIIPMLNEEKSIALVLKDLPAVRQVIVVDNGSTDDGPSIAREAGAIVISEPRRGYGQACLAGITEVDRELKSLAETIDDPIVAFLDGDYSDHPDELPHLLRPLAEDKADFVIGSRAAGVREQGAMHPQAIFGNWLACSLMRLFWGARFTDLGPFRVIRYETLKELGMQDRDFGWTIEMQIKAAEKQIRFVEIPVSYRRRVGVSKISGTVSGTIKAGYKILYTIFRYRFLA